MDERRRTFLKSAGYAALGAGCGLPLLHAAGRAFEQSLGAASPAARQWGLVIDLEKCKSEAVRRACSEACHREHNVPRISNPK